jgi:hypothetical protein
MESVEWQKDNCIYAKRQVYSLPMEYNSDKNFSMQIPNRNLTIKALKYSTIAWCFTLKIKQKTPWKIIQSW